MTAFLFPDKKYRVVYADPPWKYNNLSPPCLPEKKPETCTIEYYYPTMTIADIKALDVPSLCEKDCILFLWATTPAIREALEVVQAWEFKYKTMITWEKTNNDCMGYWFRVCTEHLIVAIRGNVRAFRDMERTCYHEKRGKHSKKPDHFYETIERVTTGNRIELFARQKRLGWDAWGNEVENTVSENRVSSPNAQQFCSCQCPKDSSSQHSEPTTLHNQNKLPAEIDKR